MPDSRLRLSRAAAAQYLDTNPDFADAWSAYLNASPGDITAVDLNTDDLLIDILRLDHYISTQFSRLEAEYGVQFKNKSAHLPDGYTLPPDDLETASPNDCCARTHATGLASLYRELMPTDVRQTLGEFYTPRGLVDLALASTPVDWPSDTICDPACGFGVFLERAIEEKAAAGCSLNDITDTVHGFELNPVASRASKLIYASSLVRHAQSTPQGEIHLPVHSGDSLDVLGRAVPDVEVDVLVGNPPWITWGELDDEFKERFTSRYTEAIGLNPHSGARSRLGHSNDDFSIPFLFAAINRYLNESGCAAVLLKRDVIEQPSGRLFRTLTVGDRPLSLAHVHDFPNLDPFNGVGSDTALFVLCADKSNSFPISRTVWQTQDSNPDFSSLNAMRRDMEEDSDALVELAGDSPFWTSESASLPALGECDHEIRHGIKDDAKSVYSIDREDLAELDGELIYPYLQSRHIQQFNTSGYDLRLIPVEKAGQNNIEELRRRFSDTYEYLSTRRETLESRSSSWFAAGEFYDVFGVGEYTWSEYKVVWCRLGFKPQFAVVSSVTDSDLGEKTVVPGDHYLYIPTESRDEAHLLCALLNSTRYRETMAQLASQGKATLSKSVIQRLSLPKFSDIDDMHELAELSKQAHRAASDHPSEEVEAIRQQIDEVVDRRVEGDGGIFPEVGQLQLDDF